MLKALQLRKSWKMESNLRIMKFSSLFRTLLLLTLLDSALGGYENPFIVALDPPIAGIEVNSQTAELTIDENLVTPDLRVAQIKYTDDGQGVPQLTPISPNPAIVDIEIVLEDGNYYMVLKKEMDFETKPTRNAFGITPTPGGSGIVVNVKDVNDNSPSFGIGSYPTQPILLSEDTTLGLLIAEFKAEDVDTVGDLVYSMQDLDVGDQSDSKFRIESDSGIGKLFLDKELDYEELTSHSLLISVTDSVHVVDVPMITTISVDDVADTPPRWTVAPTRIKLDEGLSTGITWKYTAVDQDRKINSSIEYTLVQDPKYEFFQIDVNTGILSVENEIDAEALESQTFNLEVVATEKLPPHEAITETVSIEVADLNDNHPLLHPDLVQVEDFQVTILEHESRYSELPVVKDGELTGIGITDNDVTLVNSRYTMKIVETPETQFLLEALSLSPLEASGYRNLSILLINRNIIDYENETWRGVNNDGIIDFKIEIVPTNDPDFAKNTAIANVHMKIEDSNDNAPQFENLGEDGSLHFEVEETIAKGVVVGAIKATDSDITPEFGSDSVIYRWYKNVPRTLDLDEETGVLTVKIDNAFNYERLEEEIYSVEALDYKGVGGLSTVVILNISLIDINDEKPTIQLPSQAEIKENSPTDTLIVDEIIVSDLDAGANLEVSLVVLTVSPDPEVDLNTWFKIESLVPDSRGVWKTKLVVGPGTIDRELLGRVDVNVLVTDTAQEYGEDKAIAFLSIEIEDENDSIPKFARDYASPDNPIRVGETEVFQGDGGVDNSTDYDREIITFVATDADLNEELTFEITSPYVRMLELVDLNRTTGVLRRTVQQMIDREEKIVGDEDTDVLLYTLTVFDREKKHSATVDIQIQIVDLNDNTPLYDKDYTKEPYDVDENKGSGFELGVILALDADAGTYGKVSYFLDDSYEGGVGTDKFSIGQDDGILITLGGLDRDEIASSYTLRILAKDNYRQGSTTNSNQANTTITIKINDVNDNAPIFRGNLILPPKDETVIEPGNNLGEVEVVDIDEPDHDNSFFDVVLVKVDCTNENVENPELLFRIEKGGKGIEVFAEATFQDLYGNYTLEVHATDRGIPQNTGVGHIFLQVLDVNQYQPEFDDKTPRRLFINETLLPGSRLREFDTDDDYEEITAFDKDDPTVGNGQFEFSVGGPSEAYFEIRGDRKKGIIYLKQALVSSSQSYNFSLIVTDLGDPSLSSSLDIKVFAVPRNNSRPIFESREWLTNFTENVDTGIIDSIQKATDADIIEGEQNVYNQSICYYITEQDPAEDFFILDAYTNVLSIKTPLDRETNDTHILIIHARNDPFQSCSDGIIPPDDSEPLSNIRVVISVNDVIDSPPVFTDGELISAGVQINAENGGHVYNITASSADLNNKLQYAITSDIQVSDDSLRNIEKPFELLTLENTNPDSEVGQLKLGFKPSRGMKGFFEFTVTANDTEDNRTPIQCKIYMVTEENKVVFTFNNVQPYVLERYNGLREKLSEVFSHQCNIDIIATFSGEDGSQDPERTQVETHFIDKEKSEPVQGTIILDMQYNSQIYQRLMTVMSELELNFESFRQPVEQEPTGTDSDTILIYTLIAVVGVVSVILVVVSVSCFFNSKSLSRRIRALTASTFGSRESGLNRVGVGEKGGLELPNTNQHAIQGSNPIWTTEATTPIDFDAESVGSGGSVLIGVEDDEDFKDYGGEKSNPLYGGGDFPRSGGVNPLFEFDDNLASDTDEGKLDAPQGLNIRRNPLMNMDLSGESDQ